MAGVRVLVLNSGSSSLKFSVIDVTLDASRPESSSSRTTCAGSITGMGGAVAVTGIAAGASAPVIENHEQAVAWLFDHLDVRGVEAVGHRVVHGGRRVETAVRLTDELVDELERLSVLAPLHNPPSVAAIRATRQVFGPRLPMVAVFDTAFHADMPDVATTYAIPRDLAARHHIRRYGFHGIAHASLAAGAARHLGRPLEDLRLITLQLGNGCSAAAVRSGRSIDTSMGMTPLEGLVMGTRSGDLDPAIVDYLARREQVSARTVEQWLNERSGLLGLSGRSNDMRALLDAEAAGDAAAAGAIEIFCYRVRKYMGAYLAVLGGADAVVFGGGIGEHAPAVRARICDGMAWCGVRLDPARNASAVGLTPPHAASIGSAHGPVSVLVVPVDEESRIAVLAADCVRQQRDA